MGLLLAFHVKMGLIGLWIGIIIGLFLVSVLQLLVLWKLDWKHHAQQALIRVGDAHVI